MDLQEADIRDWLSGSDAMLDIVLCKRDEIPDSITVIGPPQINRDVLEAFPERFGAFPIQKAQRLFQGVAARVARRLAKHHTTRLGVSINGLRHAWFFPVFTELATLAPIRYLARAYARQSGGSVFAVEMSSNTFTALNAWNENEVEPLYLAQELRRYGVPVFLFSPDDFASPKMSFQLSDRWLRKGYPSYLRNSDFTSVLCKNAIRRPDVVASEANVKTTQKPGLLSRLVSARFRRRTCQFDLEFIEGPTLKGRKTFAVPNGAITLSKAFVDLIGPLTQQVAGWVHSELARQPVLTAHVADHASFEGGLLAAEVVKQGGSVQIWPHSANVVHIDAHDPANVTRVTVAACSTGKQWAKDFGADKVTVWSKTILPDVQPAPAFDETQPIHIVLFAGAHVLQRMPLLSYAGHKATWTKTLHALQNADVRFVIKHKSIWETRKWISDRASDDVALNFSNTHANKLRLPNMVFLSVSMTSTAILEGIARGIPGLVVRDIAIDETPHYDPEFVPCLASDRLEQFLNDLRSRTVWEALRDRQSEWFRQETMSEI
ncbi:MAG: hypothetical protein AB3N11_11955 [Arenibacterium sp.]